MFPKWHLNFLGTTCILRKSNGNHIISYTRVRARRKKNYLNNVQYMESNYMERDYSFNGNQQKRKFTTTSQNWNMKNE